LKFRSLLQHKFSFSLQSIPGIWPLLKKQIYSINECLHGYEFIKAELFCPIPAVSYLTNSQVRIIVRVCMGTRLIDCTTTPCQPTSCHCSSSYCKWDNETHPTHASCPGKEFSAQDLPQGEAIYLGLTKSILHKAIPIIFSSGRDPLPQQKIQIDFYSSK